MGVVVLVSLLLGLALLVLPPAALPADPRVGADLPVLSPAPIEWGPETRYQQFERLTDMQERWLRMAGIDPGAVMGQGGEEAAVAAQVKAVQAELAEPYAVPPAAGLRLGAGRLVLRLSAPGEAPRAVVHLRSGNLFVVAGRGETTALTQFRPTMVDTLDLTGDGRPEIIAARLDGSGAVLTLQVFTWDEQRVWPVFAQSGAREPGQWGYAEAGGGRRELLIDTAAGSGLFVSGVHEPFLRDRLVYRWDGQTFRLARRYRFATPFYHLNRYLWFAARGDLARAAAHAEPGAQVDGQLAAWLGQGGLTGSSGTQEPFVNGRITVKKDGRSVQVDFGPTGRVLRISEGAGLPK